MIKNNKALTVHGVLKYRRVDKKVFNCDEAGRDLNLLANI